MQLLNIPCKVAPLIHTKHYSDNLLIASKFLTV